MFKRRKLPVALTIAGSDSGGGAGIQADLKTFAALGVHGTSVITCITAQNPRTILRTQACRPEIVRSQIEAVWTELRPAAMKTGMLFSGEIIRVIADCLNGKERPPLVVDPVMAATSGSRLLQPSAVSVLCAKLLPLATLVTPNLSEAEILSQRKLCALEDMRRAAREIRRRYGCAILVKGGHWRGVEEAVDIFYDGQSELLLTAPFVKGLSLHGTGCAYSAAIVSYLALGCDLPGAVQKAKQFITWAIAGSDKVARHTILNFQSASRNIRPRCTDEPSND